MASSRQGFKGNRNLKVPKGDGCKLTCGCGGATDALPLWDKATGATRVDSESPAQHESKSLKPTKLWSPSIAGSCMFLAPTVGPFCKIGCQIL